MPDESYDKFLDFLETNPIIAFEEQTENEVPMWQQELVLERIKNAKPEDYINAREALSSLKKKYGI